MKYKIGDKVWIRENLITGNSYGDGISYIIRKGERDIRGLEVEIIEITNIGAYTCKGYRGFSKYMIDDNKTNGSINYEIY